MRIDYSLPQDCSKRLYIDANFRYGYRHLYAAATTIAIKVYTGISLKGCLEACAHVIIGIAEMIPFIGHLIAFADKKINHRDIQIIRLTPTDNPFEMGKEEGKLLKEDIQFTVTKVLGLFKCLMRGQGKNPLEEARKLEPFIPPEYIQEMRGIAEGSEVSYEDVLIGNTIFDAMSLFGCSLYAVSQDPQTGNTSKEMATNYFHSMGRGRGWGRVNIDQSFQRYDAMQACPCSVDNEQLKKTLLAANYWDTIQSIIFDPQSREIQLATAGQEAANTQYTTIREEQIFFGRRAGDLPSMQPEGQETARKIVKLARNLDWPLPCLGPLTKVIVRPAMNGKKSTAVVGWPGLIGAFSGMNEDGTSIAISVVPSKLQAGMCNQFIFRKILEEAGDIRTAAQIVEQIKPASPMNLCVAARDGIALMELDPARKEQGAAFCSVHADNVPVAV